MPITLLASQCPPPQLRSTFISISAAGNAANAPVSEHYAVGDSLGLLGKLNRNGTRADLTASFGGGAYFVANGLTLSVASGLFLAVSAGTAMIDGAINVEAVINTPVPASCARAWIWLLQTGILTYTTTLTPPVTPACLLGSCVTSPTAVTAVDTSGVLYGQGILQRTTADAGMPTDTPPAGLHFYTVTKGGTYYWNGTAYVDVAGGVTSVAAGNATLTLGGTASAPTLSLNLGNANTWTAAQNFSTASVSGAFTAGSYKVGNAAGVSATLADGTTVTSGLITAGPTAVPTVVSLAASTQTFSAAGKNYLVTATFSGIGSFSDAFYESSMSASNASFTVSPNEAGRTTGVMSWIVYVPTGQTSLTSISLTASLRGRGWSGSATTGVAATWTVTQIA